MSSTSMIEAVIAMIEKAAAGLVDAADWIESYRTELVFGKLDLGELRGFVRGLHAAGALGAEALSAIEEKIASALRSGESASKISGGSVVDRPEDMSPDGLLSLCMDHEGDIQLKVVPPAEKKDEYAPAIEFVAHCPRSRHTLKALRALMQAMVRDNAENPLPGQRSQL